MTGNSHNAVVWGGYLGSVGKVQIADPTAEEIKLTGLSMVGLLDTRFSMEQDFCMGRLPQLDGLRVLMPCEQDRDIVHRVNHRRVVPRPNP
jgi:aspartate racemase